MYRFDYSLDDYLRVTDNCANHVKMLLQTRYDELEHIREALNDRYPFEDLFLKQAEVDDEKFLIHRLLEYLDSCVLERREFRREKFSDAAGSATGTTDDSGSRESV